MQITFRILAGQVHSQFYYTLLFHKTLFNLPHVSQKPARRAVEDAARGPVEAAHDQHRVGYRALMVQPDRGHAVVQRAV